eukprot:2918810-Prorocentrum_lima.AAC.1
MGRRVAPRSGRAGTDARARVSKMERGWVGSAQGGGCFRSLCGWSFPRRPRWRVLPCAGTSGMGGDKQ